MDRRATMSQLSIIGMGLAYGLSALTALARRRPQSFLRWLTAARVDAIRGLVATIIRWVDEMVWFLFGNTVPGLFSNGGDEINQLVSAPALLAVGRATGPRNAVPVGAPGDRPAGSIENHRIP